MDKVLAIYKRSGVTEGEKSKRVKITFKELNEIYNSGCIKTPDIQISLDKDRIQGIYETWTKNPGYILTERPIVIAVFDDDKPEYWLVDGQHKLNAAIKLFNDNINRQLECTFIKIENENELDELFILLNKDSHKNVTKVNSDFFQRKLIKDLKKQIGEKYKNCFKEKIIKDSPIMTIDEFIDEVYKLGAFDDWTDGLPGVDTFMDKLSSCNDKFFSKAGYLENSDNENYFYKDEIKIINNNKNCMFMRYNNFREMYVEYLCGQKIYPKHEYRNIREAITPLLKAATWKKEFGSKRAGKCPIDTCDTIIKKESFICGHVISVENGGLNELSNLRPICGDCNTFMNGTNWNVYVKEKIYQDSKKKCEDCKKKISIDNTFIFNKKIYCKMCHEKSSSDSD